MKPAGQFLLLNWCLSARFKVNVTKTKKSDVLNFFYPPN